MENHGDQNFEIVGTTKPDAPNLPSFDSGGDRDPSLALPVPQESPSPAMRRVPFITEIATPRDKLTIEGRYENQKV
jgi:hypothetical protein